MRGNPCWDKIYNSMHPCMHRSEKKDEQRTEVARRLREDERRRAQQKVDDQETKVNEAKSAYQAWKTEKDRKIQQTRSLYTYNKDPRQPPKNRWCPARSVKYPYSMTGTIHDVKTLKSTSDVSTKKSHDPGDVSITSYSSCSFESEGSVREEASPKEMVVERTSRGEGGGGGEERQTGRLKMVHVCCQTVEFWCTCDSENEEERIESS